MLIKILIIAAWLLPAIAGIYIWRRPNHLFYNLTAAFLTMAAITIIVGLAYLAQASWDVFVK